jgi:hypothetical protein
VRVNTANALKDRAIGSGRLEGLQHGPRMMLRSARRTPYKPPEPSKRQLP